MKSWLWSNLLSCEKLQGWCGAAWPCEEHLGAGMAEPLGQPEVSPSRQCPLSPAHNTQQSVHSSTGGGSNHVCELWWHLREQWDWTAALTAEAGSPHSGSYTDTAEVEPRACIPHESELSLHNTSRSPGLLSSPFRAAAGLLNQPVLPRTCQSHAQPGQTGVPWKHPQCHVHSTCTQILQFLCRFLRQILCQKLPLLSSPTFYPSVSSSYLFHHTLQQTDTHLIQLYGLVGEQGSNIQVPLTPQFPA